jgi:hypothetical protein
MNEHNYEELFESVRLREFNIEKQVLSINQIKDTDTLKLALEVIRIYFERMYDKFIDVISITDMNFITRVMEATEEEKTTEIADVRSVYKETLKHSKTIERVCSMIYEYLNTGVVIQNEVQKSLNVESVVRVVNTRTEIVRIAVENYHGLTDITSLCQIYDNCVNSVNSALAVYNIVNDTDFYVADSNLVSTFRKLTKRLT